MSRTTQTLAWMLSLSASCTSLALEPWSKNPWYWSHDGAPVLLLGGSDDDNLFQWPEDILIPQLDRIREAGGNVIRNTMSDRKDRGFEVYPFLRLDNGLYDLERWNPEYWERFERLLRETEERGIFVQIEIWDRFDYTDNRASDPRRWEDHPYAPKNNVNYTAEESGFAERYPAHPGANRQPFFFTTPEQRDNRVVLRFQKAFVNKLLDHSLKYDHVLYCMDNETKAEPEWGLFWARLVKDRAAAAGKTVMTTEMWDDWDLTAKRHRQTLDRPDIYDFADISQNNHNKGQNHWNNLLHVLNYVGERKPRPLNTTKTYGADGNKFGHSDQDAIERFWRHLIGGTASVRFHRPDSGLGINDKAVACLRAARKLESLIPMWAVSHANDRLGNRDENEAYCAAALGSACALYFPKGGSVTVHLADSIGPLAVHWIHIDRGTWGQTDFIMPGPEVRVTAPSSGNWAAAIIPTRDGGSSAD